MSDNRYRICVIGAEVNNTEQRQILSGIIGEAQKKNAAVFVLSNLYNHLEPARHDNADNMIYELISDIRADAFIMLSESFVDTAARSRVHDLLKKRRDIPVILAGTSLPGFEPELFPSVNTSDEKDMEAIVDRLIREGFTRISLLTGPLSIKPSQSRISGYRSSLEKHGIPYDGSLVYEGDFWYNSGEKLAGRYISGELPYPQALVCANDYMAFGVLDAFAAAGIDITEHMAVIGYEYIPERSMHRPLLTTYRRNREALGAAAVDILVSRRSGEETVYYPPQGTFISGQTCRCGDDTEDRLQEELTFLRTKNQFASWGLKSDMESRLTECRNYDEFVSAMGEELFIVRNASDIVLCLFENWFSENEEHSDTLICRNINRYTRREDIVIRLSELDTLAEHFPGMAVIYLDPVFFKGRLLGCCAVMYDRPDTYDDTYRHWLKSVSNGLEFLRLKTDIDFLLQCSTLSASYDGLTGLFSREGMRTAFQLMKNTDRPVNITAAAFRLVCNKDVFIPEAASKEMISALVAAAKTVSRFCGNGGIAGRISEFELLLICPSEAVDGQLLADAVYSEIMFSKAYTKYRDAGTLLYCGMSFCGEDVMFSSIAGDITSGMDDAQKELEERKILPYCRELDKLHRDTERNPLQKYSLEEVSSSFGLSPNYFNRLYKQLYGISFCQDQIGSRIRLAKHLLLSTDDNVSEIAEQCDYTDSKYFLRQFTAAVGLTPKQYRKVMHECLE
ncbi:MAG: substrate-binding domain-containing protein [Ruminococcus sp.]|nr:substrate-binding domain-containing protein [Ruminococcus sp.]